MGPIYTKIFQRSLKASQGRITSRFRVEGSGVWGVGRLTAKQLNSSNGHYFKDFGCPGTRNRKYLLFSGLYPLSSGINSYQAVADSAL